MTLCDVTLCDVCGRPADTTPCGDGLPGHPVPDSEITDEMRARIGSVRERVDVIKNFGGEEICWTAANLRDGTETVNVWHPGWILHTRTIRPSRTLRAVSQS